MRIAVGLVSILTHPLWVLPGILVLLLVADAHAFGYKGLADSGAVLLVLRVTATTLLLPGFSVLLLKWLGLTSSLSLPRREDRIVPYLIAGIFYLWMFRNLIDHPIMPSPFVRATLGCSFGIFLAFFVNLFDKVSAHAVGMGGLTAFVWLYMVHDGQTTFLWEGSSGSLYLVPVALPFLGCCLMSGLAAFSRLWVGAHGGGQILGGLFIGVFSQLLALRFIS